MNKFWAAVATDIRVIIIKPSNDADSDNLLQAT